MSQSTFWLKLKDFHVSGTYGFLIDNPLEKLPQYFQAWNELAKDMPKLTKCSQIRVKVDQMPLLDHTKLKGHRQWRLAHLQLSIIGSGYIWQDGDKGVPKKLPMCLAVPWWEVSRELGIQPIMTHSSFALVNWMVLDPSRPFCSENLKCLYELPGGREAEWFVTVTVQIEYEFARGIKDVITALQFAESGNEEKLTISINNIAQTIHRLKAALSKMHDRLTGETFYNTLRPFLAGWGGEGSPLPDGIVYEGISEEPKQMIGASAAQSSVLQTLDAVLGIKHSPDKVDFLTKMRSYMPPDHRRFIEVIEQNTVVKQTVQSSTSQELKSAFNNCLRAVVDFRRYHIQIVTKYIVVMAGKKKGIHDYESVAKKGTGGSSVLPFLKDLRSTTSEAVVMEQN